MAALRQANLDGMGQVSAISRHLDNYGCLVAIWQFSY